MLGKLKGLRTYGTLIIIAILGVAVDLQTSCTTNPSELGGLCTYILNPFVGKAIVGLTFVAGWFRKLAGSGK